MAKPPKRNVSQTKNKVESGLTGGPSNIRGVTYQIDQAVYILLDQISLALADPFTPRSITTEARTIESNILRWDIRIEPPDTTFEAKFNPRREELIEWLKLVLQSSLGAPQRRYRLVYAEERAAARLIQTVKALSRIANEVSGDNKAFDELVAREETKGADEVLGILEQDAANVLEKIELEQLSERALDADIRLRLRYLTTPEKGHELRDYLFTKLQRAAAGRIVFPIKEIIAELHERGFTLIPPERIDGSALSRAAFAALSVLENCKAGIPCEVLAAVTGTSADALASELSAIREVSFED